MKTITLLAALLVVLLALSSIASAQTSVSYTDDLDRDGIPDYRDDDRDGDGVPNDRDAYPDDYSRSTLEDDSRPDLTDSTATTGTDTTDDSTATDDICGISTPWFWIIFGSLLILFSAVTKQYANYKIYSIIAGILMIIYGFSTWTVF